MNEVSTICNYIFRAFSADSLVHTIAFSKTQELDYNKANIYPLVNVDVLSSTVTEIDVQLNYTITIIEARDVDNELNNDKMYGNNLIDNLNETHSIASRFITVLQGQNNDELIEIITLSDIRFLKLYNGCDGCQFDIRLSIPKDMTSC